MKTIKRFDDWVMASYFRFRVAGIVLQALMWLAIFKTVDYVLGR